MSKINNILSISIQGKLLYSEKRKKTSLTGLKIELPVQFTFDKGRKGVNIEKPHPERSVVSI